MTSPVQGTHVNQVYQSKTSLLLNSVETDRPRLEANVAAKTLRPMILLPILELLPHSIVLHVAVGVVQKILDQLPAVNPPVLQRLDPRTLSVPLLVLHAVGIADRTVSRQFLLNADGLRPHEGA